MPQLALHLNRHSTPLWSLLALMWAELLASSGVLRAQPVTVLETCREPEIAELEALVRQAAERDRAQHSCGLTEESEKAWGTPEYRGIAGGLAVHFVVQVGKWLIALCARCGRHAERETGLDEVDPARRPRRRGGGVLS